MGLKGAETEPDVALPNPHEIAVIAGFVAALEGRWQLCIHVAGGSEWLLFSGLRLDPHEVDERHTFRLALWRFSLKVYPYESETSEAVAEDPITPEQFAEAFK